MKIQSIILSMALFAVGVEASPRTEQLLSGDGWEFAKGELSAASTWQQVCVPHDWAIYGPFDRAIDLQVVAIEQNNETVATEKTARSGGLPFIGKGHYRRHFEVADTAGLSFTLLFDGAMSNARVKVNGKEIGNWRYGYSSFHLSADGAVVPGDNLLEVSLENMAESSRWYPGAGLFRNVHLITTQRVHIPVWGVYVTTPNVTDDVATVRVVTTLDGAKKDETYRVVSTVSDPRGSVVATTSNLYHIKGQDHTQNITVDTPELWSPETPMLYTLSVAVYDKEENKVDEYTTRFGIRSIEYFPAKGFLLNGKVTKFKGVNNHHDLGPLGAAVNRSALRHQLEILKDMGCNAIRTSHNMPAPELAQLCDEMGLMLMVEPFDDWSFRPKCPNGYGSYFTEWAARDMENMLKCFRNYPSVVMWSIGNEVPSQWGPDGMTELLFLQDICHRLDPTRPVTCGMDQIHAVLSNGFGAALDIPSFNYKPNWYVKAHQTLPQGMIIGSETASTVSSRGVYKFPVEVKKSPTYPDHQLNSYDTECASWSNLPDVDLAADEDYPWLLGQFVWTGFDYIGEPHPYDTDAWPSHSSYFGIVDLASLPKDRYWLYRSRWNTQSPTLHVLPHWNWQGREGEVTPVMVYTSYPEAELFVNGVSQGRRTFTATQPDEIKSFTDLTRFRLIWPDVVYQPGELRVVAYDAAGKPAMEKTIKTAGRPARVVLSASRQTVPNNPDELVYVTVTVVDRDGNPVPDATNLVKFAPAKGTRFVATANGDAASLRSFQLPEMELFSGACTAIIAPDTEAAEQITLRVTSPGLKSATISIPVI